MFFKQKSFLGFDIGAGGIKLVELKLEKKRPVLNTYGLTVENQDIHQLTEHQMFNVSGNKMEKDLLKNNLTINEDVNALAKNIPSVSAESNTNVDEKTVDLYAAKIKDLCHVCRVNSKKAVVSLPVSAIFHAIVTLPITKNKEELNTYIKAEVKKFVPFPLTEMSLDYQIINNHDQAQEKGKTQKILINAVPNKMISFYARIFQKAGIVLEALEPESAALSRSLVGRDSAVNMIIDAGAERTNFFIIDNGVPITHQSIDFGGNKVDKILKNILGLEDELVGQIKNDLFAYYNGNNCRSLTKEKFFNIFLAVIDPILKEIDLSFELYSRQIGQSQNKPEKIIITGGMSFMSYLTDYIAEQFKIKCYIGDPWARVVYQQSLKDILQDNGPRMAVAIGLALRNVV